MKFLLVLPILLITSALTRALADEEAIKDEEDAECLFQELNCVCPEHESLVCATNGCTYKNPCKLSCAKTELAHGGPCEDDEDEEHKVDHESKHKEIKEILIKIT